jgi:C_GCAxxG_C_C family probable redox protein
MLMRPEKFGIFGNVFHRLLIGFGCDQAPLRGLQPQICNHEGENRMLISEKFRGLTQPELLEKAGELGVNFEKHSGSCSQCTAAALREILGFEDVVVRVATSSCGGQAGFSTGACGGIIGGTIVLDYYLGRSADMVSATRKIPQGLAELSRAMEAARSFCEKFVRQYGSILCPQVQKKLYGRSFNLQDPADWKAFEEAGGHSDPTKCMSVVGNAARWALETLIERQVVTL